MWRPSQWRASTTRQMWVFLSAENTRTKRENIIYSICVNWKIWLRLRPNRKLCLQVSTRWRRHSIRSKMWANYWLLSLCSAIICNTYQTTRLPFFGTPNFCATRNTNNFRWANGSLVTMKYSSVQSERQSRPRNKIIPLNSTSHSKCTSHVWKLW